MPFSNTARTSSIVSRQARAAADVANTLEHVAEARAAGAKTNVAVSNYLNEREYRTPLNCPWTPATIGLLLKESIKA
ncbi:MAG: hypothetical protein EOP13_25140 [Pseudomonas sp.]|uniref:hypothetical protein n=1 Tax=Pseudomonas sp. TaxID=306 RepID=UPI0012187096|nr:hypothetical protein [Pseudomonas sp.]RZI68403.1 MAG: hypothetical protein EOP13_25140 [Pseudomonas sp.]